MTLKTRTRKTTPRDAAKLWDKEICLELLEQLWALRQSMLDSEIRHATAIDRVDAHQRDSARNLIHYLALRATDLRALQEKLSWLGVSSLGRAESHVLANLDKVIGILHRLTDQPWQDHSEEEPAGSVTGRQLLQSHTKALLGPAQRERRVRIMVTLPSEAASDYGLVRRLIQAGMDVARINCAHDDAQAWQAMAQRVRRAAKATAAPAFAITPARWRPKPLEAPEMKATLPLRLNKSSLILTPRKSVVESPPRGGYVTSLQRQCALSLQPRPLASRNESIACRQRSGRSICSRWPVSGTNSYS